MKRMQALKGLVVGLGILIVIGFVLLIYGFYTSFSNPDFKVMADKGSEANAPVGDGMIPMPRIFGETRISLPNGCTLIEIRPEGDRLYLRTGPTGLCERIIVIDSGSGEVLGTIVVMP